METNDIDAKIIRCILSLPLTVMIYWGLIVYFAVYSMILENCNIFEAIKDVWNTFQWPFHLIAILLYWPFVLLCYVRGQFKFVYRSLLSPLIALVFYIVVYFIQDFYSFSLVFVIAPGVLIWLAIRKVK